MVVQVDRAGGPLGMAEDVHKVVWRDPQRVGGTLLFRDTRVPVQTLVDYILGEPNGLEDFLDGFPSVSREQAEAYLRLTPAAVDALAGFDPRDYEPGR